MDCEWRFMLSRVRRTEKAYYFNEGKGITMAEKKKHMLLRILCISLLCFVGIFFYSLHWEEINRVNWKEKSEQVLKRLEPAPETVEGLFRPVEMSRNMPALSRLAQKDTLLIAVPLITQQESGYQTGCELVSGAMLLNYYGSGTTAQELYEQMDRTSGPEDASGNGVNPAQYFIGNPTGKAGYGCYAGALTTGLNRVLNGERYAVDITGTELEMIEKNYIEQGTPVIIWATVHMSAPREGDSWKLADGSTFQWIAGEHCLVLVGADDKYYYFNDPDHSGEAIGYEKELVRQRYEQLGKQAIIISR